MLKNLALAFLGAFLISGCQDKPADFPKPTRYGEFDLAPQLIFQRPAPEVEKYLKRYRLLGDTGISKNRRIQVRDHDRIITATLTRGYCNELHITGRIGDSIFPKKPEDFMMVRDRYAGGHHRWTPIAETEHSAPLGKRESKGKMLRSVSGGNYAWAGSKGRVYCEVSWHFDEVGGIDGDYEFEVRER